MPRLFHYEPPFTFPTFARSTDYSGGGSGAERLGSKRDSCPKKAAPSAQTPGNVVIRNSPAGTALYDDARGIAKLTKDVSIVQTGEDFILKAQEATYNRQKIKRLRVVI